MDPAETIEAAASAIRGADALLIGAGAGMGVDSGLPDFRGDEGFWRAYPPFKAKGLSFVDLANPRWFRTDPKQAWGFYGHRRNLYRETTPHPGFGILKRWAAAMSHGAFVFTSNVDGQFERAGFSPDRVYAVHGAIDRSQCARPCHDGIWQAEAEPVAVDDDFMAYGELPTCPRCGGVARPNILMFGDARWLEGAADQESERFQRWLAGVSGPRLVVVELGAGSAVPTVRYTCERVARALGAPLVRINPREPYGPHGTLQIAQGALEALRAIDARL